MVVSILKIPRQNKVNEKNAGYLFSTEPISAFLFCADRHNSENGTE